MGILAAIQAGLSFLARLCGLGEKITAEIHDAKARQAGRTEAIAENNSEAAKVNAHVAKAVVTSTDGAVVDGLRKGTF